MKTLINLGQALELLNLNNIKSKIGKYCVEFGDGDTEKGNGYVSYVTQSDINSIIATAENKEEAEKKLIDFVKEEIEEQHETI